MSDPFIGEIRPFACNYAPTGWVMCNGQVLPIATYTALFAVIGTVYGGDGRTTFALPNLQGRVPLHAGKGAGLTDRPLGANGGAASVTLASSQLSSHSHALMGSDSAAASDSPVDAVFGVDEASTLNCYRSNSNTTMRDNAVSQEGGGQAHNNMQPYQVLNFCIALQGIFPPRP